MILLEFCAKLYLLFTTVMKSNSNVKNSFREKRKVSSYTVNTCSSLCLRYNEEFCYVLSGQTHRTKNYRVLLLYYSKGEGIGILLQCLVFHSLITKNRTCLMLVLLPLNKQITRRCTKASVLIFRNSLHLLKSLVGIGETLRYM